MIIRNCTLLEPGQKEVVTDLYIDDATGRITDRPTGGRIIDADRKYVTPGFIDTHIHGAFGSDTSDGSASSLAYMASILPDFGVAAFCPTTMTEGEDVITKALDAVEAAKRDRFETDAIILGVHLEGPFMSPEYAGVQDKSACIVPRDALPIIDRLEERFPGLIRIIDVAPELDGGIELISTLKDRYVMSLAHTGADYDTAVRAFEAGACSVTHLLNAMSPFGKRDPGVPAAAYDKNAYVELICDGIHIAPPMLRMMFDLYPKDRIIIVSDAMRGAGMPDGTYKLADADVEVRGGRTYYGPDGGLAGSVTNLAQEAHRLYSYGIDKDLIVRALTVNPLRRLGLDPDECGLGTLKSGALARVNILDKDMTLVSSICGSVVRTAREDVR